jgi:hypothetical protein
MKTRTFVLLIVLLLVVSLSFAEDKITIEDTYGTWVNSDYNFGMADAVIILNPDGTASGYGEETDTEPASTWIRTIEESWNDSEGNLWIKCISSSGETTGQKCLDQVGYELNKFSNSGLVWECVWMVSGYPKEMSPVAGNYGIYYRQE